MKIAYCTKLLPEEKKLAEKVKGSLSGVSLHKFATALIHGLDDNNNEPVKVFNIINTLNYPKFPALVFPTEKWQHTKGGDDWHIGYINLVGIKYVTQAVNQYLKLVKWVKQCKAECPEEKIFVIVHDIFFPSMIAAKLLKKRFPQKVTTCLITGDLPGSKYGLHAQHSPGLKNELTKVLEKWIESLARSFDSFVFATKYMAEALGVQEKPFTVVECAYDYKEPETREEEDLEHKTVFYAGATRPEYGIPHLLKAFSMIEGEEYRLWIAGGGSSINMVKEYAEKDKRIQYLGFISPSEVDRRQDMATAIISARCSGLNFVKYSFPSKTMEGLASGRPYIAHRLPCEPPEYSGYIQYPDDESDEAFARKIVEICEMPREERMQIADRAKRFILEEKNPRVMCKRIIDLFQSMSTK